MLFVYYINKLTGSYGEFEYCELFDFTGDRITSRLFGLDVVDYRQSDSCLVSTIDILVSF